MNPMTSRPEPGWTIDDLRQHFGMIPAERFFLDPAPGTAREKHILRLDRRRNYPAELLDGVLIDRARSGIAGALLTTDLLCYMMSYLKEHPHGIVISGAKCPTRLGSGQVRLASLYYISWKQMPNGVPDDQISDLVPEIVCDLFSSGNTKLEMHRKRREFFAAGTTVYWLIDHEAKIVEIYKSPREMHRLTVEANLECRDLLPGFTLPLAKLFASRWEN